MRSDWTTGISMTIDSLMQCTPNDYGTGQCVHHTSMLVRSVVVPVSMRNTRNHSKCRNWGMEIGLERNMGMVLHWEWYVHVRTYARQSRVVPVVKVFPDWRAVKVGSRSGWVQIQNLTDFRFGYNLVSRSMQQTSNLLRSSTYGYH